MIPSYGSPLCLAAKPPDTGFPKYASCNSILTARQDIARYAFGAHQGALFTHNPEHRGGASGTFALHRLAAILHGLLFGIFHFSLRFTLNAIAFGRHDASWVVKKLIFYYTVQIFV